MIVVVAAGIIIRENKILVVQRNPATRRGLFWEFPGGKLEEGENPRQCIRRELEEELGVQVEPGRRFEIVYHPYEDVRILLLSYLCCLVQGEPQTIDCHALRWVTQKELKDLPMTSADIPVRDAICASEFPLQAPTTARMDRR
jgi:mutator protein MutT